MNDEQPSKTHATAAAEPAARGLIHCKGCRTLNEPSFGSCIRCGEQLVGTPSDAQPSILSSEPAAAAPRPHEPQPAQWWAGRNLLATKFFLGLTFLVFGGQAIAAINQKAWGALIMGANVVDDLRFGAMLINSQIDIVTPQAVLETEPWRMLSSVFVHFGLIHFAVNMAALVQLARLAEPAIGSVRFAIVYVVSGIAGFALSLAYFAHTGTNTLTAGASGAIFGVMGLILGFLVRRRDPRWKTWAVQAVFYSLIFGMMLKANNTAHIGGLIVGAAFGVLFAPGAPKPATRWQKALALVCVAASVLALLLAQLSPLWQVAQQSIAG